ncbi:MAG: ATP-binding cassette domain-containing protein [candidate division Zixibacteria bacterium]|nr:ATP-binding cassette domain-containing protein [candidate division Zixibacteria bacterium]
MEGVSFEVQPGTIFGLLGPNGAGKTTLVRILSTLIIPSSGTAQICGYDIRKEEAKVRASLGVVIGEERAFYYRLNGFQNLEFFGGILGLNQKELKKRIEEKLKLVGLENDRKLPFMKYSTGMKKKLNIARGLLIDPQVYLLDEPNSGIDPDSAIKIRQLIVDLKEKGRTILLTTHNMDEADRLSDTIGILREGKLVAVDTPGNLRRSLKKRILKVEFKEEGLGSYKEKIQELFKKLKESKEILNTTIKNFSLIINLKDQSTINQILSLIAASNIGVMSTKVEEANLEDVFVEITRG